MGSARDADLALLPCPIHPLLPPLPPFFTPYYPSHPPFPTPSIDLSALVGIALATTALRKALA